jgi:cytochrome c oxidase subunit 2
MTNTPIDLGSFWLPKQSSTVAQHVDHAWNAVYWVAVFFFVLVITTMAVFVWRYRRKKEGEQTSAVDHNTRLEVLWTLIPLAILMGLFAIGLRGYIDAAVAPAEAIEVHVTAQKWAWSFTYPNGTTTAELGVPKDKPVKLVMSSTDVVHSLFIPEFRIKQDVVPGTYTSIWFQATEAKEVALLCTEYCGTGHSDMMAKVIVMEPPQYQEWLDAHGDGGNKPPAERGKMLFATKACAGCHSLDGSRIVGPSMKGIYGRTEDLADGASVKVDDNYIRESILVPTAKIVKGYAPSMPTFQGVLKDKDIDAIIAYLKTVN